jgi:FkbM family methyltransferase
VSERFPNLPLDKTVFVSHHKEYNDSESLRSNRLIMLADFLEGAIVIPHYFGKVNITPKNDVAKFFVIGTVQPNRRNLSLLFSAVEQLAKQRQQFTVTAIGEGFEELQIPQSIRQYFNFTGKISYPEMYQKLEDADYFLPLLDLDKPEHNRYITEGTSGSFLLIYGFRKPAIIANKFALPHHLTNENSIIYETNNDLTAAMRRAIELPRKSYSKLQEHLAGVADDIYQRSLDNLRKVVGAAVPVKAVHKTIANLIQTFSWKLEVKEILNDFIDVYPLTTVQCNNLLCQAKAKQLRFNADTAQDIIAYLFFNGKTFGFFVDIGAHNGVDGSTTFWAEQLGWKGICVEPQPSEFQALQRNRRCALRNCAVSNKTGTAEFISFPDSTYWSGLAETMTPEHVATAKKWISEYHHKFSGVQRFTVQTNTFDDIMRDFPDVSNIDFLSIDTEGHELPVLQSIDFSKYRFGLIAIETRPDSESSRYLEQQGYQILLVTRSDTIFVPCNNTNSLTISSPPKKIVQCNKRSNKELMEVAASWTHSLELEYVRTHNPSRISNDEKIKIFYYDTYISNKCNLRCNQCCHFSPFRKTIPTKEELIDSYDQWSKRIDPEVISVGGGEPLLHPDFQEVVLAMRRCFPNALIQLITNGMLLPKLTDDNIKELFDAGRIAFRVSRHLNNDVVLNRNIERLQSLGMPLDVQNCRVWWSKSFCTDEQEIPYPANNDPEKIAAKCYGKVAVYLGNVFYCCLVANTYYAVKEGVLGKEWQFLRQHKPMTLANTQQEILNYITKEFIPECSMCPEDQFTTRVPARQLTQEEVETVLRNAALSTLPKIKLPI